MFGWFTKRRRAKLTARDLPREAETALLALPYVRHLPQDAVTRLKDHVKIFLAEKHFEGCGGFNLTPEAQVIIAAYASILILNRETEYYPRLTSILVYPHTFVSAHEDEDEDGIVSVGGDAFAGESWDRGVVVLAWDEVLDSINAFDGYNVVFHEFAHQLDEEDGIADGAPPLSRKTLRDEWAEVFQAAYEDLVRDVRRRRRTVIDDYGAQNPAEFFAVITEMFFELPAQLQRAYPQLYALLKDYFRQDPIEYFEDPSPARTES